MTGSRPSPWAVLLRRPPAALSLAYLTGLVVCATLAPLLAPRPPSATDLDHILTGPTSQHLLGTDDLGRDVLSRLLYGGRASLLDATVAVTTVLLAGVSTGLLAGYRGGWFDRVFTWIVDAMLAIPVIVTLLLVLTVIGNHQSVVMIALGLLVSPGLARVVRGATLAARQELHVAAAKVAGLPGRRILRSHILPAIAGPIIVQASLLAGGALLIDAGLSYLGFGAQPPTPTWGNMIAEAANVIARQPWLLAPPGAVLALAILACALIGDAIRDATTDHIPRTIPRARNRQYASRRASVTPRPALADTSLLALRGVTVALPAARTGAPTTLAENIDLSVLAGEAVGLVGESGCGKSVTARTILGLVSTATITGSISFSGNDLPVNDPRAMRKVRGSQIALISQDPVAALDPMFTVGQQIGELLRRHHGRTGVRQRVLELLEDMNFSDPHVIARRYPHQLSGGMAQRVGIAMALAGRPRLLIADEPTTALDASVQADILNLLRRLQTEHDMAILLIGHDLEVIAGVCQRTYVMYAGHVVETAPVADLLAHPAHPYTAGLLAATPRRAHPGKHITAIPGTVPEPAAWPAGCHFAPRCAFATPQCEAAPIPLQTIAAAHHARCLHPITAP